MNPNSNPSKSFSIPITDTLTVDIKIHVSRLRAQGLDLTPWASTYVLATLLHKLKIPIPPTSDELDSSTFQIPILELGAGIGLVGMVAAILWKRKVILTDLEPIVPGLTHNIELNGQLLDTYSGSAIAGALDWGKPSVLHLFGETTLLNDVNKACTIIAADTIYDENHPGMLADCILKWLARTKEARVILTYPLRVAYLDQIRELWSLLEDGGLEALEEGKEMAEAGEHNWDDERLCEWSIWTWKERSQATDLS